MPSNEWDEDTNVRIHSRMPHNGWAGYGPYTDRSARIADRIIVVISVIGLAVAIWWGL
jgi:hypothetical protein